MERRHTFAISWSYPGFRPAAKHVAERSLEHAVGVRSIPENGDVVVREEMRNGTCTYVLHTAPGADQRTYSSPEEAFAHATVLAERERVRVWLTDEGYDFLLLEDFRMVEPV
jgi:hypothetical protein